MDVGGNDHGESVSLSIEDLFSDDMGFDLPFASRGGFDEFDTFLAQLAGLSDAAHSAPAPPPHAAGELLLQAVALPNIVLGSGTAGSGSSGSTPSPSVSSRLGALISGPGSTQTSTHAVCDFPCAAAAVNGGVAVNGAAAGAAAVAVNGAAAGGAAAAGARVSRQAKHHAKVRELEQQVAARQAELSRLMQCNLHLNERAAMMEELCAFMDLQATFVHTRVWPKTKPGPLATGAGGGWPNGSVAACNAIGLLGDDSYLQQDDPSGDEFRMPGSATSAHQVANLSAEDVNAHIGRMISRISLLLVQAEGNPAKLPALVQCIGATHKAIAHLVMLNPRSMWRMGHSLDNPNASGTAPDAHVQSVIAALKLSSKQVERLIDLHALIQPRLSELDVGRRRLIETLRAANIFSGPLSYMAEPPQPAFAKGGASAASSAAAAPASTSDSHQSNGTHTSEQSADAASSPPGFAAQPASASAGVIQSWLVGQLSRSGAPPAGPSLLSRLGLSSGSLGGTADKDDDCVMYQLTRVCEAQKSLLNLQGGFTACKVLSSIQVARMLVNSFPWLPDPYAMGLLLTQEQSSQQQQMP